MQARARWIFSRAGERATAWKAFGLVGWVLVSTVAAQVLPPPPGVDEPGKQRLAEPRLYVREFQFEGNRAFTDGELALVVKSYTGRELNVGELEEARRAVTLHYVNRGYINSGAVIPDQDPADGVVLIRVVEGELSEIKLEGNRWLWDHYILGRLRRWAGPPLNLVELQEGLQLLRQNPNVLQVNAELQPGAIPGQSSLDVQIKERQPFRVGLQFDNQRPPSVGAEQIWLLASDLSLTGHSDPLELKYGIANAGANGLEWSGVDNLEGRYRLPVTPYDTTLSLYGSRLNTLIVEDQFQTLDIESLTESYGIGVRQPLLQTPHHEFAMAVSFDHRRNNTWLLGERFNVSPGAVDGEMIVSVLRVSQEWVSRGQDHVLALRSTFNFGLDVLDATDNGIPGDPDGTFVSWLGQGQYVRRLFDTQNQVVLRLAGQWTDQPLLALEQMSVGGFETVRGYLENQLVRDRGLISSVEFRLPVIFNQAGAGIVHVAPFFDFGAAWEVGDSSGPTTISSTGLGLLVAPSDHFTAQIYWGYRLRDIDVPDDAGLQGYGFGIRLNVMAF
jgi:hemolysin activation/secretion protein